jgi:hypothetical protein
MFDLISDVVDVVVDFFTGDEEDEERDPCDVGDCLAAQEQLDAARDHFQNACHWVGIIKVPLNVAQWIVSRSLTEIIIALVIAVLVAGPLGIVIVVGIYATAWIVLRAMLPVLNEAGQNLATAIAAEQEAIIWVLQECPESCQGDLDPSQCVHLDEPSDT